jgi:hypothetical protein
VIETKIRVFQQNRREAVISHRCADVAVERRAGTPASETSGYFERMAVS